MLNRKNWHLLLVKTMNNKMVFVEIQSIKSNASMHPDFSDVKHSNVCYKSQQDIRVSLLIDRAERRYLYSPKLDSTKPNINQFALTNFHATWFFLYTMLSSCVPNIGFYSGPNGLCTRVFWTKNGTFIRNRHFIPYFTALSNQ